MKKIVEKIAKLSNLSEEEIAKKIEAKREALSGLISFEGAAQIVAAELGIRFDNIKLNIEDLLPGMRKVNVLAKIVEIDGIRKYVRNGKELKVASMLIADATGSIRVVLWDTKHIALIEEGKMKKGDVVEISRADVRGSMESKELHLGGASDIAISNTDLEVIEVEKYPLKTISQLVTNSRAKIRAFVVQAFVPSLYDFCVQCNKKIDANANGHEHATEKRMIFSFIADDGTESIRAIAFGEEAKKILKEDDFDEAIKNVYGEEFWLKGRVRRNSFRDALEFVVEEAEPVDVKKLIEELSK